MWLHPCSRGSKVKQQKAAGAISSACCQEEFLRRLEKSNYAENLANLSQYAKEIGVYKKMMSVMEVLLNG